MGINQEEVINALRECYDPCCREQGISVVDMGLIQAVEIEETNVTIKLLLTTAWCPFVANLYGMMEDAVKQATPAEKVTVEVVWDTVWTTERLSDSAKTKLTIPLEPLIPLREKRLSMQTGE
jgi:metal-sulfur cluster biosynthetic enzyme